MNARCRLLLLLCVALLGHCPALASATSTAHDASPETIAPGENPCAFDQAAFDNATCDEFCPCWSARLGAVLLQRGQIQPTPIVVNSLGSPLVDASDYVFPFTGGADVWLIRYGEYVDFDFRYFGVNQWSASQNTVDAPPGSTLTVANSTPSPNAVNLFPNYNTSLNSLEWNVRRNVSPRFTVLAGFRYLQTRDNMFTGSVDQVTTAVSNTTMMTSNTLYGAQLGLDVALWDSRWFRLETAMKAGLYGNSAGSTFKVDDGSSTTFLLNARGKNAAFSGDMIFTGVVRLNDHWALRAGYQLLWLAGLAIAPEQLSTIDMLQPGTITNTAHGAFYHGALVGVERSW